MKGNSDIDQQHNVRSCTDKVLLQVVIHIHQRGKEGEEVDP